VKRILFGCLVTLVSLVSLAGLLGPAPAGADPVTLDGVTVRLPAGTTQVVTVNHTRGYHARVVLWRRDGSGWVRKLQARGRTGYGGLVVGSERKQGTGTTPLGTYKLLYSFGTHARQAGWGLGHRRIRKGDYWVQDNRSAYYNRYRNKASGGFRWWLPSSDVNSSERLRDFPHQYEYAIVIGFNYDNPVRHRGSGIFLHVNGDGATAGCVSAPRWFLRSVLNRLEPGAHPVIAIGR
jgi:L,D-peptidoglycan transpeptidase YkuD (ErfK/YbiS/YcfS/YnhG family)